jgi:hypothetical protein
LAKAEASDYSRIDFYLEQVADCLRRIPERLKRSQYFVADGNYAKMKMFTCMSACGKDLITRLRSEGDLMGSPNNLRYLYPALSLHRVPEERPRGAQATRRQSAFR